MMKIRSVMRTYTIPVFLVCCSLLLGLRIGSIEASGASRYQIVVTNCTWAEAVSQCQNMGGHLANINSEEEWYALISLLDAPEYRDKVFYLGGQRAENSRDYYWTDSNGYSIGEPALNSKQSWAFNHWGYYEPSYEYRGVGEYYITVFKYQGSWILNDDPYDMVANAPEYSGIIGFVCEFDQDSSFSGSAGSSDVSGAYGVAGNDSFYGSRCYQVAAECIPETIQKWRYDDFDGDGEYEAFVVTGDMSAYGYRSLWYISDTGNVQNILNQQDCWYFFNENDTLFTYGQKKLLDIAARHGSYGVYGVQDDTAVEIKNTGSYYWIGRAPGGKAAGVVGKRDKVGWVLGLDENTMSFYETGETVAY
ncbi:MAG: C-type lectin domain-containing protein [Eubacteriales bacterium]|nr:C-type lectin domain-containing protein [Eubacteriales bacterium]